MGILKRGLGDKDSAGSSQCQRNLAFMHMSLGHLYIPFPCGPVLLTCGHHTLCRASL